MEFMSCRCNPLKLATFNPADVHGNLEKFCRRVQLLITLAQEHPLSQRTQIEQFNSAPRGGAHLHGKEQKHAPADVDRDLHLHSSKDSIAAHFPGSTTSPSIWPTPSPAEWSDIELITTRACVTLQWAQLPRVAHHLPPRAAAYQQELVQQLCNLIHQLVGGHVLDMRINMKKLFNAALLPVLRAYSPDTSEPSALLTTMFPRLAADSALIPHFSRPKPALESAQFAVITWHTLRICSKLHSHSHLPIMLSLAAACCVCCPARHGFSSHA